MGKTLVKSRVFRGVIYTAGQELPKEIEAEFAKRGYFGSDEAAEEKAKPAKSGSYFWAVIPAGFMGFGKGMSQ